MGAFDQKLAAAVADSAARSGWLSGYRDAAMNAWLNADLPGRKTEAWKYTSIEALSGRELGWPAESASSDAPTMIDVDADRLVFVDGVYRAELSQLTAQDGLTLVPFSAADESQQALIMRHLGSVQRTTDNPFLLLNDGWLADGVLIHAAANVVANKPVYVVQLATDRGLSQAVSGHTLVVLEHHAELTLTEHFIAGSDCRAVCLGSTEILLREGASLSHYRAQLEGRSSVSISAVALEQAADSRYNGFMLATGSDLKRIDLNTTHRGRGSEYRFDGVYLARGDEHVDIHSCVDHAEPNGTTDERFRGIIDDSARAVFNGRIHIHPHAQKTSADLSNRNLLLSPKAEVNTKPELEIYADDVSCSHGATVSQIDERSLYYLQSRGINRREAEVLLGFGFVNELLGSVEQTEVHDAMRAYLREWYGSDDLTRHLA